MGFFQGVSKKEAVSWALFDFANSSYSLLVMTFVFPLFFRDVIAGGGSAGDFWWGLTVSISILLGGILSPIVGAVADADGRRKSKFILFSVLSMIGTIALYFTGSGSLLFGILLFVVMNVCFEVALSLYDSFLLHVSTTENSGRISGLGWGLGYVGGIVAMLLFRPLYSGGYVGGLEERYLLTFPLTALFFFLFSLPAFFFLKEQYSSVAPRFQGLFSSVREGVRSLVSTLKNI